MVNIRNRVNTRTNTIKRGVGNHKKSCAGLDSVHKKSDVIHLNLSTVENPLLAITKSGRIGKKTKGSLKMMDNILQSELLISDNRLKKNADCKVKNNPMNSLNNNSIDVGDQNEKQKAQSKAPKLTKRKANNKTESKDNRKKIRRESPKLMEPLLREEVINKMKSILSSDEKIISISKSQTNNPNLTKKNNEQKLVEISLASIKCSYCQKPFNNKSLLGKHLLSHEEIRPHKCSLCPKSFRYQSTLKVHVERQHPDRVKEPEFYRCAVCDETFLMPETLELHFMCHIEKQNVFKCIFCKEKFTNRLQLKEHEKAHSTEDNLFKCDHCLLTITNRSSFVIHMKKHKSAHDFICQYCGKEFHLLGGIKRHVRACHNDETIKCPICKKKLKGHMSEHLRVHQQKRPHICTLCGQAFTQCTQLTVHKRSHTGARPYSCKICNKSFGHSNALMLHIRIHTGEKPFQCAMCPLSFSQLPHMKTHMIKIHGKEHAYKCMKCDEFFKFKRHLDAHEKICNVGKMELTFEEKIQASVPSGEDVEAEAGTNLSALRYQLALLVSMIASTSKLKYLGFNKRLIDDLLEDSIDAIGLRACKDKTVSPMKRLRTNIEILLGGTVSKKQMNGFRRENKTIEEILLLLTGENNNRIM